ncbi:diacylglycerol/lipid kinase family protein [Pseudoduganella buxea]|uniref:Diacylglycerol kinase n=1 Tax=Pseudoduganella buxea TaxID=1949069 RepID=A0A6I3SXA4_9BURK|nr:diacylglycerol kinase family protein [Pseudoduganella buxea]MTV53803.1 sphingosine kinase [Pseudoduganella buxea]GGC00859.1 diacylglycerol kinase [Pseudoduganella buxea]
MPEDPVQGMLDLKNNVAVIVNAAAGLGYDGDWAAALRGKFAAVGLRADVTLAASGDEMIGAARDAVARGVDIVAAGGGDGTINAVASVMVDSDITFAVLPLGTLNHFAKDLGIPLALDEAIATIVKGSVRRVDVGEVNGRVFLNNSSLGLYPDIVRDREKQQRRLGRGKWLAFCWASVAALRRFPFLSVRLKVGEDEHARRTPFVFIGNNEYLMQGLTIGERAVLDGGKLSLYVAQRPTRRGLVRFACHALLGRLGQSPDFDVLLAECFAIDTRRKLIRVATDGEVTLMAPPLNYRSRPAALAVIVPR